MMLEIIARSHRGRICEYKDGGDSLTTPAVIALERSSGPSISFKPEGRMLNLMGAEVPLDEGMMTTVSSGKGGIRGAYGKVCVLRLPIEGTEGIPEECEIIAIPNAFELRRNPRGILDAVMKIREMAGFNRLVYMSGIADPSTVSLLTYMGVDLFDDTLPIASGLMGIKMFSEGEVFIGQDFSRENSKELKEEADKVKMFVAAGRLRELVDQRAAASPTSVALLRLLDDQGYQYQEEACTLRGGRFCSNTVQSLRRPDVERYRRMLAERYRKPEHKRILLLLPCSARKPYHTSRSHKAFSSAIHTADHDTLIHEVILTSPLGLVPRELDVFYPADSYDIPVTGEWNCQEKEMIRSMLSSLLEQGYDKVICHFPDHDMIKDLADMEFTVVDGRTTSFESLDRLDSTLRDAARGMEIPGYMIDRKDTMRSILGFQFGLEAADVMMDENTFTTGKFPYWKIIREVPDERSNQTQLGMLTPERGMVSLTLEGGEVLSKTGSFIVEIMDFDLRTNLFAVGILDADPNIRIGDDVVVMRNGKVEGVGVAEMCGREMVQAQRGMAVRVRHKSK
ncbi:MAG TPA: DUF5591 domain-containing protein [Candidatus Methanomethylophilaceae archaeon]|nr:DUF5591 domain-containing protein [Candidatus Methanomethylophilaceae archaeon]